MKHFFQDSVAKTISSLSTTDSFPGNFRSKLKKEWLDSCTYVLNISNPGFVNFDLEEKEKLIFERFLLSNMKFSCSGVLPEDIHNLAQLPSPLVLQVNQMVDLNDDPQDNRLLLTMTDGVQFIYGKEIKHNEDLNVSLPAGFKVAIHKARILNGLIRLVPEGLKVLGGMVQDLGAARDKVMEEVIADREPKSYDEIVSGNTDRLSEEYKAMPYTYLASLLEQRRKADGGATIRGKIQGMMTGLSKFEFGRRTEYELIVHFDDGSCTSDVLIHPNEVERQIGLTPKEISGCSDGYSVQVVQF